MIINYFLRIIRALLGLPEPSAERLIMVRKGMAWFVGNRGRVTERACAVTVYSEGELSPAANVAVKIQVMDGPVEFADGGRETVVHTNSEGDAEVDIRFTGVGAAMVSAEMVDDPDSWVDFNGRSEGVTHELQLFSPPTFAVDPGQLEIRIIAVDHNGAPVTGADLFIQASQRPDIVVVGVVTEIGDGVYRGAIQTNIAGQWTVTVQDRTTKVLERRCVHALPGKASEFLLVGETDPRLSDPRGQLLMRVQLLDRFLNPLDPERIGASLDDGALPRTIFRDEARFIVSHTGYGHVPVRITDTESDLALEHSIHFAAAVLEDPGFVEVGKEFRTPLYGFPPPDRPAKRATIEIEFDPELTSFVGIERGEREGPAVETNATLTRPNMVSIEVVSGRELSAEEWEDGLYVCTPVWSCGGEGESCFNLVGRMSPSTPGWKLCVNQKARRAQNLCINIIYPPGDANALAAGRTAATNMKDVLNKTQNVERCCPVVNVTTKTCQIPRGNQWREIRRILGNGKISSVDEINDLFDLDVCKRSDCFNIRMIPFDDPEALGRTQMPGLLSTGESALDPDTATTRANVGMHELSHALGLDDKYKRRPDGTIDGGPAGNVMSFPHGDNFTQDQCKEIWDNIDDYGG